VQGIAAGKTRKPGEVQAEERMSVNSVSTRLPPSYSPLSGSNSPTARPTAAAQELRQKSFARSNANRTADAAVDDPAQDASVTNGDSTDVRFQSTLEDRLQQGAATAGRSTGGTSGSSGGQSSPGIALYQRVSQYGNSEPRTSALLASWNNIMKGGDGADGAAAAFAKALSQNETPGSESGVIDLTA
jgi:hypothetical protein